MKNKIIALSVLLSILSGGCVNMQQSKDLLTIDVTKDYLQKEFALQDIFDIDYIPLDTVVRLRLWGICKISVRI